MAEKSPEAFRTITEVSEWLETPTYVLRFWESRFPQIKPVKRAGGRRYYRPEDMRLLGGIKRLLHFEGQSIKAVKELIREKGVKHVMELSPDIDQPVRPPQPAAERRELPEEVAELVAAAEAEPPAPPKVSARVIKKGKAAARRADAGPAGDDRQTEDAAGPADQADEAAKSWGGPSSPELLSVRVIKQGKRGAGPDESAPDAGAQSEDTRSEEAAQAAQPQDEREPEAAQAKGASKEVATDVTKEPQPQASDAAQKAARETPASPSAAASEDGAREEWELEDPMIIEPVPYRVRARHHYTETQLASIQVLVAELAAVRDRIAGRIGG